MQLSVTIQTDDFDVSHELALLRAGNAGVGAVCCFVGTVRERSEGAQVSSMELEHYPGMTEKSIQAMMQEAAKRFDILGARVIHRVGLLQPQDQIVLVAVTSAHRGVSFQACEFLMDYLKTQAPFWKKEMTPAGAKWVDARVSDDQALAKWGIASANVAPS
jgi:molybdopterin synthase catalytic subunit